MNEVIKMQIADGAFSEREFAEFGLENFIYMRPVKMSDLAKEVLHEGSMFDAGLPPDAILFSLHAADGSRIAVTMDEMSAIETAQHHELQIATVH